MVSESLVKIGLSKSESEIYLKLLEVGSCKAGRLAKETNYNRTTIYKALESLIQRGLVSYVLKENRKYFEPSDPKNIIQEIDKEEECIKKKKEEIKNLLPKLGCLFEKSKEEMEAKIFKGVKGMKSVFNDILKTMRRGDEYLAFGVPKHAESIWGYFEEFNKTLQKNKVKSKIIFDERAKKNIGSCKRYGYEVRTLSKEFMSPAEVNIYKDNVVIVLWHKTPLAILIKGEDISKSFRQYFELLWKIARL